MNTASTALLSTALALAGLHPLRAAHVDLAHNSVKAGTSRVKAGSSLAAGTSIVTGSKARTQISLGNNGSVARAGSMTEAVLQNETGLSLRQGVMLASSGNRLLGREAVTVETPETKTTVKGTMLVAYQPKVYIKVTCIEGQVTVKLKALMGEFVALQAGEMVIINPAEKRLPEEVEVDLDELGRTCSLLGAGFPQLVAASELARAIDRQVRGINEGDALRTQLVLTGAGLEVTLSTERGGEAQRPPLVAEPPVAPPSRRPATHLGPSAPPSQPPYEPPPATGPEYIIDETTEFIPSAPSLQTPDFPRVDGLLNSEAPTIWEFHNLDPYRMPELLIRGLVGLPSTSFSGDSFLADGLLRVGDDGLTTVSLQGPVTLGASQAVTINFSRIDTASDYSSGLVVASDRSVEILNSALDQSSHVHAIAPSITVDHSTLAAGNNGIRLGASGAGTGIIVKNSSQLLAMVNGVGNFLETGASSVVLTTEGAPIAISDSTIEGSEVLIDASGPSGTSPGTVDIRNSVINGDLIRARAFNHGGSDALVIDGGSYTARSMIKFYAEGASTLRFRGNVALDTPDAILAGRTVEVDRGGNVNIRGRGTVYADFHNYNNNNNVNGTINASSGLTTSGFGGRPGF